MPQTEQRGRNGGGHPRAMLAPEQAPQHAPEGDFLEQHRAHRDQYERGQQGVSPAEVVAGIPEGAPGQRQRRACREHRRDGADRGECQQQSTPPRSPAQAELGPAQPGPPGHGQQSRGAGRAQHQRRMRDLDVDHVDKHEEGDDEDDRPVGTRPGKPRQSRHVGLLPGRSRVLSRLPMPSVSGCSGCAAVPAQLERA
jgi:hypothetical protein